MIWEFTRAKACVSPTGQRGVHGRMLAIPRTIPATTDGTYCAYCWVDMRDRVEPLRVEADTFFDARAYAQTVFHTTDLAWREVAGSADVVLRWEGTDAGVRSGRRLVVTEVRA